jgi:hypothetical protein
MHFRRAWSAGKGGTCHDNVPSVTPVRCDSGFGNRRPLNVRVSVSGIHGSEHWWPTQPKRRRRWMHVRQDEKTESDGISRSVLLPCQVRDGQSKEKTAVVLNLGHNKAMFMFWKTAYVSRHQPMLPT